MIDNIVKPTEVTLFLIEDDEVDAETVIRNMRTSKIINPVVRATDGIDALELLAQGKVREPFVILLDLNMPRMNGIEFLDILRNDKKYAEFASSVVFVLTTSRAEQDMLNAYSHLIAGYFHKNEAGTGGEKIVEVLNGYWHIVILPSKS